MSDFKSGYLRQAGVCSFQDLKAQEIEKKLGDFRVFEGLKKLISPEKQGSEGQYFGSLSLADSQDMLMNAPVGIFVTTPEGKLIYANLALIRIFGYDSPQEAIESIKDLGAQIYADPKEREDVKRLLEKSDETLNYECRFVRKDGSQFWASCSIRAARKENGKIVYYQGFFADVTERKQEREALLKTQFAMDKAPESIFFVDHEGGIVYANEAACASMGYIREELQAMKVFDIDPDFPPDKWEDHKEEMRCRKTKLFESRHRTKDGRIFPVEVITNYMESDGRFWACAFDRDITERKKTEEALKESEARFRKLFQKAPMAMAHIALDGTILAVNERLSQTMGHRIEDVPTLEHAWALAYPDPDFRQQVTRKWRADLEHAIAENSEMEPFECPLHFMDGNVHTMIIKTKLIGDSVIVSFFDITKLKQAEEDRKKLQEQLHQSQKLEAVGILAGGVAHDFNNMLGSITGFAELTLGEMEPSNQFRQNLVRILDAARRSASLTRQLLAFARKQTIEPILFDLNESIDGLLKMLHRLIGENIEIAWRAGKDSLKVKMDPTQFDQILVNLCVNAKDAINGVGRISIETEKIFLDQAYCDYHAEFTPGEYALLAVSDDGCGMEKDNLKHIFEPFFTTKGLGRGTGLGLATVYGIVRQHEGFINVYSEPGKGTTFRIYIPLEAGELMEKKVAGTAEILYSRGESILMVEDDSILLEMGRLMLERLGYSVITAATPKEAIELVEENSSKIDLFITDVVMPEMNGRELADRIQKIRPGMKHLFMSGYTADIIVQQGGLDEGINFIQKPFLMEGLSKKIREILD